MRKMEFKMERQGLLEEGQHITVTEGVLPIAAGALSVEIFLFITSLLFSNSINRIHPSSNDSGSKGNAFA